MSRSSWCSSPNAYQPIVFADSGVRVIRVYIQAESDRRGYRGRTEALARLRQPELRAWVAEHHRRGHDRIKVQEHCGHCSRPDCRPSVDRLSRRPDLTAGWIIFALAGLASLRFMRFEK